MSGTGRAVAVGEAMVEMVPVGGGLYRRGFAGDTFNTAWHMAQLLAGRAEVGFASRVGQDSLSEAFLAEAAEAGLDTSGIGRDPDRTMGLYLIELDGVERSFHYWRRDSAARALADDPSALARALEGAALVHLSGITVAILPEASRGTLLSALAGARAAGARVSFDPNIRPRLWSSAEEIRRTIPAFLELADIALPSFDDERAVWGDADPAATLDRVGARCAGEIVVKNGPDEVRVSCGGRTWAAATPRVEGIIDTTGAGDAFNAGYLAIRLLGGAPDRAIAAGQAVAAEVLRCYGARGPAEAIRALGRELCGDREGEGA